MPEKMPVYVCQRYNDNSAEDSWAGALIIAAPDVMRALFEFVVYKHHSGEEPHEIKLLENVYAEGEPRVLYDDWAR